MMRGAHRICCLAVLATATAVLAACSTSDGVTGLRQPNATARFLVGANIHSTSATQVFIAAFYLSSSVTAAELQLDTGDTPKRPDFRFMTATIADLKGGDQAIPFSVNLAPCLADPRVPKPNGACPMFIHFELLKGQNVLPPNPL